MADAPGPEDYSPAEDDVFPAIPPSYLQKEYICCTYPCDHANVDGAGKGNPKAGITLWAHPNGVAFLALHPDLSVLEENLNIDQGGPSDKKPSSDWLLDFDVGGSNLITTRPMLKKNRARGKLLIANEIIAILRSSHTCYDLICPVKSTLLEINEKAIGATGKELLR
jgi:hypothetical protein